MCPQQDRALRCREGPDIALGPGSSVAELQAGGHETLEAGVGFQSSSRCYMPLFQIRKLRSRARE